MQAKAESLMKNTLLIVVDDILKAHALIMIDGTLGPRKLSHMINVLKLILTRRFGWSTLSQASFRSHKDWWPKVGTLERDKGNMDSPDSLDEILTSNIPGMQKWV